MKRRVDRAKEPAGPNRSMMPMSAFNCNFEWKVQPNLIKVPPESLLKECDMYCTCICTYKALQGFTTEYCQVQSGAKNADLAKKTVCLVPPYLVHELYYLRHHTLSVGEVQYAGTEALILEYTYDEVMRAVSYDKIRLHNTPVCFK